LPNTAGLHLAARLVASLDAAAVAEAARRASIGLHPLAPFHLRAPVQSGFLFGYASVDVERMDAALTSLATLLRTF
jgi:GntR family transcriptional regulator / MocR family aminotransferase